MQTEFKFIYIKNTMNVDFVLLLLLFSCMKIDKVLLCTRIFDDF